VSNYVLKKALRWEGLDFMTYTSGIFHQLMSLIQALGADETRLEEAYNRTGSSIKIKFTS
jgi:hypothetical protein